MSLFSNNLKKVKLETLEDLKNFLKEYFKNNKAEIYLFGSRARGDNTPFSDIDLAIFSPEDLSEEISALLYILEESNFPYKVDIVDLKKSPYLMEIVKKEGIKWL